MISKHESRQPQISGENHAPGVKAAERSFSNEKQQVMWNKEMARRYDLDKYYRQSNVLVRWVERARFRSILQFLSRKPQGDLLEIGCGAGNVLELVPAGRKFAIDLSAFLLGKARERLGSKGHYFVQANAGNLPFPNQSFGRILCTEVIEHVPDPGALIKELARLAKPDAVVVITIPNEVWINRVKFLIRASGLTRLLLRRSPVRENEWHLHDFDLSVIRRLTSGTLRIRETKAIPWRVVPLRYVLRCAPIHQPPDPGPAV